MAIKPPGIEDIEYSLGVLEDIQAASRDKTPQLDAVIGTIHWILGNPEGRCIQDFIAVMISKLDQLNAAAEDRNKQEPEGPHET